MIAIVALFRSLMFIVGVVAIAFGLLFTLQGLGIVHWPSSSFMLDDRSWAIKGVLVMVVGAALVWLNRPGVQR